jgi:hypothetical protein
MARKKKNQKKWFQSKSIWLGVCAVGVAVLQAYQSGLEWEACVLAGFGAAAVVLRSLTEKKITL